MRPDSNQNREKKLPDADHYKVRCIQWIDLGTQESDWKGQKKQQLKLLLTFELLGTKEIFNPDKGEQPFTINKEFTNSLNEKSNLLPFLEGWRGKSFSAAELEKINTEPGYLGKMFINQAGYLNVIHKQSKNGKTYANIASLGRIPKSLGEAPKAENPILHFDMELPDKREVFPKLYQWIQTIIEKSPEWNETPFDTDIPPAEEDIPVEF